MSGLTREPAVMEFDHRRKRISTAYAKLALGGFSADRLMGGGYRVTGGKFTADIADLESLEDFAAKALATSADRAAWRQAGG